MLKVLIADDERKVGLLVKNLIEWEELGLEFMDIVQDGQTAYEVIMAEKPDIVITDIRMPSLTGLEMIQKVTESGLQVHFIVISGYRYFEYAQSALKYGVKDYLLKPIDEDELNKILKKVCEEEEKARGLQQHVKNLEKNLENSKHMLHRELMERVFEQQEKQDTDITDNAHQEYTGNGLFQAVGIKVDRDLKISRNKEQEALIINKLTDMIGETIQPHVIDLVVSAKRHMWILVLLNFREEDQEEISALLNQVFYSMKNYIGSFENYEITMGQSSYTAEFSKINLILEMAREAVRCRIFEGCGICIRTYSENRNKNVKGQEIVKNNKEAMGKYIQVFRVDDLDRIIRSCFAEAEQEKAMACEFFELAYSLLGTYCAQVSELFHEDMTTELERWKEEAANSRNVSTMKKLVLDTLKNHLKYLEQKQADLERKPILDTIEYVKNNYGQKILLEDVAEKFGFHPNYFSEIFKKETGKNFSVYLLEVRMEAAKKLLRDSSDNIYEIASQVGYKDSKFFSQQFTKTVGIKPTEYRRLYF